MHMTGNGHCRLYSTHSAADNYHGLSQSVLGKLWSQWTIAFRNVRQGLAGAICRKSTITLKPSFLFLRQFSRSTNIIYPTMFEGKKFNPDTDISDLAGKTILVTGGRVRLDCQYSGCIAKTFC